MNLRRINSRWLSLLLGIAAALALSTTNAGAQTVPGWGRFSLFTQFGRQHADGGGRFESSEIAATFTLHSGTSEEGGFEYAFDTRSATYPSGEREGRVSVYDAYLGLSTKSGLSARVGQMWLNELGGLGSLGGLHLEYRQPLRQGRGRYRAGVFYGVEPKAFEAGFVTDVTKGGVYVAFDGSGARRHVLGYVTVRNTNLVERSTLTMTNFVPLAGNTFFLYQAAEYDLQGPAGQEKSGLNYLFCTARYAPFKAVELQVSYHHGLSIDARSITNDQLSGRPVNPDLVQGLLFESARGRLTIKATRGLRFWAGYGSDRNSRDAQPQIRTSAGLYASDVFGSGLGVAANVTRVDRATAGSYHSWYASVGRGFGSRVYVSLDYTTSLSLLRTTDSGGFVVESRPASTRYSVSSNINLTRAFSLMFTAERLVDLDSSEDRSLVGLTYRF